MYTVSKGCEKICQDAGCAPEVVGRTEAAGQKDIVGKAVSSEWQGQLFICGRSPVSRGITVRVLCFSVDAHCAGCSLRKL